MGKNVMGNNANIDDLKFMGKKVKLKISLESKADLSDINTLIQNFKSMEVIHRVLRYRKFNGKSLPSNEENLRTILQTDSPKVVTNKEKKDMRRALFKKSSL